jgi:hypothetical protein
VTPAFKSLRQPGGPFVIDANRALRLW